jgi:hypothetical protein
VIFNAKFKKVTNAEAFLVNYRNVQSNAATPHKIPVLMVTNSLEMGKYLLFNYITLFLIKLISLLILPEIDVAIFAKLKRNFHAFYMIKMGLQNVKGNLFLLTMKISLLSAVTVRLE